MRSIEGRMRIAVTGLGLVSPLGNNVTDSWENLLAGRSGVQTVDYPPSAVTVAAHVKDFNPQEALSGLPKKFKPHRMARSTQFSLAASREALQDARLLTEQGAIDERYVDKKRVAVVIGSGLGGGLNVADVDRAVLAGKIGSPTDILRILPGMTASQVSGQYGFMGATYCPEAECATGGVAIESGVNLLLLGKADKVLVGSAESSLDARSLSMFESARAATTKAKDPQTASRPFDRDRSGIVLGEGAGVLVLEKWEDAIARGAEPYAEIIASVSSCDGDSERVTDPTGEGVMEAMAVAFFGLEDALRNGRPIFISAHATSTISGDPVEARVISDFFSSQGATVQVHTPKGSIGHGLGASAGMEAVFLIKTLKTGIMPPNLNIDNIILEAESLQAIRPRSGRTEANIGVNNCFGFGGINNVTVFKNAELLREI